MSETIQTLETFQTLDFEIFVNILLHLMPRKRILVIPIDAILIARLVCKRFLEFINKKEFWKVIFDPIISYVTGNSNEKITLDDPDTDNFMYFYETYRKIKQSKFINYNDRTLSISINMLGKALITNEGIEKHLCGQAVNEQDMDQEIMCFSTCVPTLVVGTYENRIFELIYDFQHFQNPQDFKHFQDFQEIVIPQESRMKYLVSCIAFTCVVCKNSEDDMFEIYVWQVVRHPITNDLFRTNPIKIVRCEEPITIECNDEEEKITSDYGDVVTYEHINKAIMLNILDQMSSEEINELAGRYN